MTEREARVADLLQRLRERKLGQWALAYLTGAWVVLQVLGLAVESYDWPRIVMQMSFGVIALGFVVALVLAWYHGERGTQKLSGTELLILTLLLAIGGALLWRFAHSAHGSTAAGTGAANQAANTDRKSIAVLPFINMSGDKDNEYFSDGISEEILNVLAKTPDLHVAARTSSFAFKGKSMEVPAIALELNVRMVLEGSVRKQGDRVRITAQLIDAKTGFHVWSQTYDRQLQDIFAIQDEIAKSISDALEVKLADTPSAGGNSVGTSNLKAYDLYLRGLALWNTRRENGLWQAIGLFEQATVIDPKFAQGYAGEALTYAILGDYSQRISYAENLGRASDYAERALALDPSLPEPYAALGMVAARQYRRATADAMFGRAIALKPSFATAWQWRGSALTLGGDLAGGLAAMERASALDPRALVVAENHAFALRTLGRDADARTVCMRELEFAPTYFGCMDDIAMADLQLRDFDAARSMLERLATTYNPSAAAQGQELTAALAGHGDRHALALRYAALPFNSFLDPASGNALQGYDIAAVLMLLGEHEIALGYLERLAGEVGGLADWAMMLPVMNPIRCEPRFVSIVKKLKTTDPYYAKVCAGKH
jgi:TolB-like protein/Tfp pilus assembly protein PilF